MVGKQACEAHALFLSVSWMDEHVWLRVCLFVVVEE